MTDDTLNTMASPGAYQVDPVTARRAALYVAGRLGRGCGDVLDALGLRPSPAESQARPAPSDHGAASRQQGGPARYSTRDIPLPRRPA